MARESTVQIVVTPDKNRVVRYKRDQVGNDLTAVLRWCARHAEAVWVFDDGSFTCPHSLVVEWDTGDHELVDAPWEA